MPEWVTRELMVMILVVSCVVNTDCIFGDVKLFYSRHTSSKRPRGSQHVLARHGRARHHTSCMCTVDSPLTDLVGAYGAIITYTPNLTQERLLGERESHLLVVYDGVLDYCWR